VLLDDRPGPVYLQAWGGTNTIAKALARIQKQHPAEVDRVSQKAVLFIILDQDNTFRTYVEPNWPKLQVLGSFRQFGVLAFGWRNQIPPAYRVFFERPWLEGQAISGRLAVVYSQNDLGGAWARGPLGEWEYDCTPGGEAQREAAMRLGVNVAMYALCTDYKDDAVHLPFILKRRS